MRKIPRSVEDKILRRWLEGYTQRQAAREFRVGLATVNRVIDDARKRTPDLDELRGLNVMLRKGDSSVVDAIRGARLLDGVNKLGVSLDRLESFIKLSQTISSERGVEAERFIEASVKLMGLEAKTGKSYEEVVKDFEERMKWIEDLEAKAKGVQEENRKLVERRAQVEGEIREARESLSSTHQELNKAVSTQERLKKIGLEKVSDLARFVEEFELLGFDTNVVRKLASWRKSLAEMDIDPDKLGEFIKKKGSLEKQISNLSREKSAMERKVKELKEEHMRLWNQTTSLRNEISRLTHLGYALKEGRLTLPCKVCRMYGISLNLTSIENAIMKGSWCSASCIFCGQWSNYTPLESAWYVAQLVLPALRPTRTVAKKR